MKQNDRHTQSGGAARLSRRRFLRNALALGAGLAPLRFGRLGLRGPAVASAAGTLLWGPYLQSPTTSSITVMWATTTSAASEARFSSGGAETTVAATTTSILRTGATQPYGTFDSFFIQSATLTGLTPGVSYSYRVLTGGTQLGASTFTTARPANDTAFSFVVLGDSGSGNLHQKQVADRIAQLAPEFILHCGDIIGYPTTQPTVYDEWYTKVFAIYGDYQPLLDHIPIFPSIGNHDYQDYPLNAPTNDLTPYTQIFTLPTTATAAADKEKYYSFDYGNAHFVTLDAYLPIKPGSGGADTTMVAWLKSDLASTGQFWKVVWLQTGPYSSNAWSGGIPAGSESSLNRNIRQVLVPIFQQYNVDIVLAGDQHIYERSVPWAKTSSTTDIGTATPVDQGGIVYVITGGGGGPRGEVQTGVNRGPWSVNGAMVKAFHTTRIAIDGAVLTLTAHEEVNGTLPNPFDSYTIDRSAELGNSLTGGAVSPEAGAAGAAYTFQVTYTNASNQAPAQALLLLDSLAPATMTRVSGSYSGGALYQYQTTLGFGTHQFAFDFGGGLRLPASGTIAKPLVNSAPNVPAPISPSNGATGVQPSGLALSWSGGDPNTGAGDTVTYDLYLGAAALPGSPTQTGLTSTSYTPPAGALSYGTGYVWQVVAKDSLGATSTPAAPWAFATLAQSHQLPSAPSNPSPADGATNTARSLQLSWAATSAGGDPVTYDVKLQGSLVATELTSPSLSLSNLTYGTNFAWQVTARSLGGATDGPTWHFTTLPNLSPQLSAGGVTPATGTTQTTFSFQVTYVDPYGRPALDAAVVLDGEPQPMSLVSGTPANGAIYRYTTTLAGGIHTYHFAFANQDGGPVRLPSNTDNQLTVHAPPSAPSNPSPADGATNTARTLQLAWSATSAGGDPVTYDVTLQGSLVATELTSPSLSLSNLTYGTSFAWQVAARSLGGVTDGPAWHFTTQTTTPPQLSAGGFTPSGGTAQTTLIFQVTYTDQLGRTASSATVVIDGTSHAMTLASGTPTNGAIYRYTTKLAGGVHTYHFAFAVQGGSSARLPADDGTVVVGYSTVLPLIQG